MRESARSWSCTAAVSLILQSVRLTSGDEVLLTDHGYGANAIAVRRPCRRFRPLA